MQGSLLVKFRFHLSELEFQCVDFLRLFVLLLEEKRVVGEFVGSDGAGLTVGAWAGLGGGADRGWCL